MEQNHCWQPGCNSQKAIAMLLSVQHLCIANREKELVSDISFSLEHSSTLGIVGESGSGKTLTGLSVMGLLPKELILSKGEVIFSPNGETIVVNHISEAEQRILRGKQVSMIFQEPMTALNPVRTCGSQLLEVIKRFSGLSKVESLCYAEELFNEVLLPNPKDALNKYPHQMSGGQRQRVMIAMAIASRPKLLIADEPTTALDVTVQKEILRLLKSLQERYKMGMLFISHDLGVINQIADNVLVMRQGRVVETGKTSDILRNPKELYTQLLIACKPKMDHNPDVLPTIEEAFVSVQIPQLHQEILNLDKNDPILKVENLSVEFRDGRGFSSSDKAFKALNNVSVEVFRNETVGLVGESGCGKTTLGRTIMRLTNQTDGSVFIKGKNISGLQGQALKELRKKIQYVFQDPYSSINPHKTIYDTLAEPIIVHKLASKKAEIELRVKELLLQVGLSGEYLSRYPHQLSGGQRQRVVIARALALEPELIICDESVAALDVSVQAQVLNLLNRLKKQRGLSYLFISHDLSVVKYMSDRVYVMNKGQIEEHASAEELYRHPKSDYTKRLIEAIPEVI